VPDDTDTSDALHELHHAMREATTLPEITPDTPPPRAAWVNLLLQVSDRQRKIVVVLDSMHKDAMQHHTETMAILRILANAGK
jgi:cephalosporin hydroxylase